MVISRDISDRIVVLISSTNCLLVKREKIIFEWIQSGGKPALA
jgi:hypothetical protein